MTKRIRYSSEVRERAVLAIDDRRMVFEHEHDYPSLWAAIRSRYDAADVTRAAGPRELPPAPMPKIAAVYPNPLSESATVAVFLPQPEHVRLDVFDLLGRRVRTLLEGWTALGTHEFIWDRRTGAGNPVSSGVYVCRLVSPTGAATARIIVAR